MNIVEYQDWTLTTAVYPEAGYKTQREFNYLQHGAAGEGGETSGYWSKLIRSNVVSLDGMEPLSRLSRVHFEKLLDEIGDELWYLARKCDALGITLEQLANRNAAKLEQRKMEGRLGSINR